jgi:hypothetical protein
MGIRLARHGTKGCVYEKVSIELHMAQDKSRAHGHGEM